MDKTTYEAIFHYLQFDGKIKKLAFKRRSKYTMRQLLMVWTVLQFKEPPSLSAVALAMGISYQGIASLIKNIDAEDEIKLVIDPQDGRVRRIVITNPEGDLAVSAKELIHAFGEKVENALSPEEIYLFIQVVNKLSGVIDSSLPKGLS